MFCFICAAQFKKTQASIYLKIQKASISFFYSFLTLLKLKGKRSTATKKLQTNAFLWTNMARRYAPPPIAQLTLYAAYPLYANYNHMTKVPFPLRSALKESPFVVTKTLFTTHRWHMGFWLTTACSFLPRWGGGLFIRINEWE